MEGEGSVRVNRWRRGGCEREAWKGSSVGSRRRKRVVSCLDEKKAARNGGCTRSEAECPGLTACGRSRGRVGGTEQDTERTKEREPGASD